MPGFINTDFYLYDPTDPTKQLTFDTSALPTASIVTLVVPPYGVGATSRTLAFIDGANTFTGTFNYFRGGNVQFGLAAGGSDNPVEIYFNTAGASAGYLFRCIDQLTNEYVKINAFGDFEADTTAFADATDPTKRIKFDVTPLATATTRTFGLPDASGRITTSATPLTSGRVPFATTGGILTDDADFTFATDTLTVTKIAATTFTGDVTIADTINLVFNTSTGTKIGTGTTQKLAFWNTAPIAQPTTGVAAATFVANTSGIVDDSATFDGYTLGQVVKALRLAGLLA